MLHRQAHIQPPSAGVVRSPDSDLEMSFRGGEYYGKRCEQTNRQLLKAIESLARVRRLLTPMQINIGQNQINLSK